MTLSLFVPLAGVCQVADTLESPGWEFSTDLNAYFMKDDFTLLPVIRADKNWLHLEGRYNYEDIHTVSLWGGYNFSGGGKLEYTLTPMAGFVIGESDGFAPGLEMTWTYGDFELYSESEYLINFAGSVNNYFYMWSDLSYSPLEWLWFGISGQRTRVYETSIDIQRGLMVGGGKDSWEVNTYFYNPGSDDFYVIAAGSVSF